MPGAISSQRMRPESAPPTMPAMMANRMYSVPMSLWFVEKNQRAKNGGLWSSSWAWS